MEITNEQIWEMLSILDTRITTINDRTKAHTIYIKQLERKVKELSEVKGEKNNEN